MKRCFYALLVPLLLSGCFGDDPVALAKEEIKKKLRDPSSAKFGKSRIDDISEDKKLYKLYIEVSATNMYGGPSGVKEVYCASFMETKNARCLTSHHPDIF